MIIALVLDILIILSRYYSCKFYNFHCLLQEQQFETDWSCLKIEHKSLRKKEQ